MKIVVLAGGTSTERDVSLSSGSKIYRALKNRGHKAILLDVWLGYESETPVTEDLFGQTSAKYLHVLPVRHGEEVADSVLYGARSAVFARAANLIYVDASERFLGKRNGDFALSFAAVIARCQYTA